MSVNWENRERSLPHDSREKEGRLTMAEYQWQTTAPVLVELKAGGGGDSLPTDMSIEVRVLDISAELEKNKETEESKPRETFVVIGGMGEDLEVLKPFLLSLAKEGKQVVAVTMPGYGNNLDPDENWRIDEDGQSRETFELYSRVIGKTLADLRGRAGELGILSPAEKVTVIGHSIGGLIAADFANRHLDAVRDVFLISPAGLEKAEAMGLLTPGLIAKFTRTQLAERLSQIIARWGEDLPPVIKNTWLKNFLLKEKFVNNQGKDASLPERVSKNRIAQRFWETWAASRGALGEEIENLVARGLPVAVLAGENDSLFSLADYRELVVDDRRIRGQTDLKMIEGQGHYGLLDAPDQYVKEIMNKYRRNKELDSGAAVEEKKAEKMKRMVRKVAEIFNQTAPGYEKDIGVGHHFNQRIAGLFLRAENGLPTEPEIGRFIREQEKYLAEWTKLDEGERDVVVQKLNVVIQRCLRELKR